MSVTFLLGFLYRLGRLFASGLRLLLLRLRRIDLFRRQWILFGFKQLQVHLAAYPCIGRGIHLLRFGKFFRLPVGELLGL